MISYAYIVCGSPDSKLPYYFTPDLKGYMVGVDRGALALVERNIDFDVAVGDFDSVSESERKRIEGKARGMLELPVKKDVTDCEAAIVHVMREGCREIYLYGAMGARFDHQYVTIGLMLKYAKQGARIHMVNDKNRVLVLVPGFYSVAFDSSKKYVSFFALESAVKNLALRNVEYPLEGYDLAIDDSLCVSNKPLGPNVDVSFDDGYLMVVQSTD